MKHYYAALNVRADLNNGNQGFANTWEIARFFTKAQRDAFVDKEANRRARAVTRKGAAAIFAGNYEAVGKPVPAGGLFGRQSDHTRFFQD